MHRLRALKRPFFLLAGLLLACGVIAMLGPWMLRTMNPTHLAVAEDVITQIWWPATVVRLLVYALLAWGIYPAWVRMRGAAWEAAWAVTETPASIETAEIADTEARATQAWGRAHFARAVQRQRVVFGGFLLGDLLLVQFPCWLLRG